jgi:uncharacterized membrane protein
MLTNKNPWEINTRTIVLAAIFGALVVAMQLVGIGSIPVPNLSGRMTLLHIPVILGAVIGGPIVGMFAGLVMGIQYLLLPDTAAFGFLTLVPSRLIFALVAWLVYRALAGGNKLVAGAAAGLIGSITNTVVTLGFAVVAGLIPASGFIGTIVPLIPQILVEAIAAAIITPLVAKAVDAAVGARG